MQAVYGSPRKPLRTSTLPNMKVAPAVDKVATANDKIAFQSVEDIMDWDPYGPNTYREVRKKTDPFLDDKNPSRYWPQILPKLVGHFQVVRDLLTPRIKQSQWL
jgi:hypothetical protein